MTPEKPVLASTQRAAVRNTIASGAIEGWRPTAADADLLRRIAAGAIAAIDAVRRVQELHAPQTGQPDAEVVSAQRDWCAASWRDYFYPGTTVLVNRLNLRESKKLAQAEGILIAIRTIEATTIASGNDDALDGAQLRALHHQLSQDLYVWAGHYRSVPIGKRWSQFAPVDDIAVCVERAASITADTDWLALTDDEFAEQAANVYSWLNYAHPFRDINGRAARLFMNHVAAQSHRIIDYSRIPGEVWIQRSAFTVPDQDQTHPQPGYMTPVFRAISSRRAN